MKIHKTLLMFFKSFGHFLRLNLSPSYTSKSSRAISIILLLNVLLFHFFFCVSLLVLLHSYSQIPSCCLAPWEPSSSLLPQNFPASLALSILFCVSLLVSRHSNTLMPSCCLTPWEPATSSLPQNFQPFLRRSAFLVILLFFDVHFLFLKAYATP